MREGKTGNTVYTHKSCVCLGGLTSQIRLLRELGDVMEGREQNNQERKIKKTHNKRSLIDYSQCRYNANVCAMNCGNLSIIQCRQDKGGERREKRCRRESNRV